MVKLPLLPVFDAQVCPVVLGNVDLVGLDGVQQLLLLGQVALKEELVENRHGGLVQLDNLNEILVKKEAVINCSLPNSFRGQIQFGS